VNRSLQRLDLQVDAANKVSALLQQPPRPRACIVLAHGAGAGMEHPFMTGIADGLDEREFATLRYQFPYMERGSRRPDSPALARAAVRAAVALAAQSMPGLPLFAGGKSFGGRMTSQAQALSPLPDVMGLIFFGFPLHPARQPATSRGVHLFDVHVPMLFLQGANDALASAPVIEELIESLKGRATLRMFENADHSFHAPRRSGCSDAEIAAQMLDAVVSWAGVTARIADGTRWP
jgi:predicted alpha/beta-hydrolase family hydrolase